MLVASISDAYHIAPAEVRKWKTSDVLLMQRYWSYQQVKRAEENAADSPARMKAMAGSM